jgi:hypothetical protein
VKEEVGDQSISAIDHFAISFAMSGFLHSFVPVLVLLYDHFWAQYRIDKYVSFPLLYLKDRALNVKNHFLIWYHHHLHKIVNRVHPRAKSNQEISKIGPGFLPKLKTFLSGAHFDI